jgi:hypothetical protein
MQPSTVAQSNELPRVAECIKLPGVSESEHVPEVSGGTRLRESGIMACLPLGGVYTEYIVAYTADHSDCIICPKAYLDGQGLTAFFTRKPYPIVKSFNAASWEEAVLRGAQLERENVDGACPV